MVWIHKHTLTETIWLIYLVKTNIEESLEMVWNGRMIVLLGSRLSFILNVRNSDMYSFRYCVFVVFFFSLQSCEWLLILFCFNFLSESFKDNMVLKTFVNESWPFETRLSMNMFVFDPTYSKLYRVFILYCVPTHPSKFVIRFYGPS